jgi:hypothetical protein
MLASLSLFRHLRVDYVGEGKMPVLRPRVAREDWLSLFAPSLSCPA